MFYDLQGEENMSPIVGILFSAVKENSQRLQLITEGMSQEELDYKGPDNNLNSTAQLIKHIMYVDLNWVYRMKGQPLPHYYKEQYGPMIDANNRLPMVTGKSLNTLMSNYEVVLNMLKDTCIQIKDADLDTVVTFGHENEKQATIRWGLWHISDHSRYHQAHINLLRKWYNENSRDIKSGSNHSVDIPLLAEPQQKPHG
ncbi:DinB family protein [Paenibacillus sp. FSL H8-0548]|uniref:DinB family protein n=1 Tax=Paenibacillus sp. FSL H8-0548 TaxID=1920422 RepID=UPI0009F85B3B|nr:DinB family protein [Paenibacillus sp. FSL H8-0548]